MLDDNRHTAAQLTPVRDAQALDLLGKVLPVERQIGAGAGRLSQSARLLLGPADEVFFIKLCNAAGHILSSGLEFFPKVFRVAGCINLDPNGSRRTAGWE